MMVNQCKLLLGLGAGLFLIWSTMTWAGAPESEIGVVTLKPAEFILTVEDEFISLGAREASLQAIVQEIGRKMSIKVEGTIPEEETVTTAFSRLPVAEALQHLSPNYGYQIKNENGEQKIATIFVLPQPKGFVRPQPIPQEITEDEPETSVVAGTSGTVTILPRQPEDNSKEDNKKSSRPAPFGFSFDPSVFQK